LRVYAVRPNFIPSQAHAAISTAASRESGCKPSPGRGIYLCNTPVARFSRLGGTLAGEWDFRDFFHLPPVNENRA
jgi:hypothetical protein